MSVPSNFEAQPVARELQPAPAPPRYLKQQIYADPRVFKHIDDHAINEARTNYRNFRDLIWNLIYKKNFNDLEKVRAIFRWMTTKNMYTIMFDSELPGSAEAVLGGFKDGATTYARIFECLCLYSGLHCTTNSGWAKGVEYRPGNPITSGPINHSWNSVNIDGNWQLVDSHWATRYLQKVYDERKASKNRKNTSERNTPENLVYEYDDFYFLTVPASLIYSHCPEDPAWQLLYPARSRAEFEDYPLVKSFFFNVGMGFQGQNQGVLHTRKGILVLTLGYSRPTAFTFKLGFGDSCIESVQGIALKRYVIQETGEGRVSFYLRAPKEGNYYLTIYAQAVSEKLKVENVFKAVCEYKVVCEQAAGDQRPYPQCSDSNWGPGAPVRQYGLSPSQMDAIMMAKNGRAEVCFTKSRDVRLYAKLTQDGMDEDTLERCVSVREQDNQVFVTVHLPTQGEYGLEIYANDPDREGDTFTHVCQYLTAFIDRDPGTVYGQAFNQEPTTYNPATGPVIYPRQDASVNNQYATMPGQGGQRYGPGGNQVYPHSNGNSLPRNQYRNDMEASRGHPGYNTLMNNQDPAYYSQMAYDPNKSTMYQGKPGQGSQELLPPPAELISAQNYNGVNAAPNSGGRSQESHNPWYGGAPHDASDTYQGHGGSTRDIPYASGGYVPPEPQDDKNLKPLEVVYVPGGPRSSPYSSLQRQAKGKETYDVALSQKGGQAPGDTVPGGAAPPKPDRTHDSTRYVPIQVEGRGPDQYNAGPQRAGAPIPGDSYHFGGTEIANLHAQRPTEPETEYRPHDTKVYTSSITIEPPAHFVPVPVAHEAAPKAAPPVVPPKPFKDTTVFQHVDEHAVEVSKEEHKNFRDLVWHLIYARDITNELEKARAIFLWLCSKDLSLLNFDGVEKGSPEEILMNLQKGQTTYAVVYETLCSYAGLHCKTISGYAKGAEYKPGMRFTGEQGQHSWNGVLVEGAWRLVDCHWAARRLVGKKVSAESVRYELDEYYFMPDPHQLIFTHFPDDMSWQLLERPISLADFENLVPVKSAFFKYGLQILSHREAVIKTKKEVTIRIGCPPFKSDMLAFTFTLAYDDGREEYKDVKLSRYGMQEMLDNVSFFTIRPPEAGSYRLILYAKDLTQTSVEGVYGGVCEYEVVAEASTNPSPFPPCVHTSWGPGDSVHKYDITPLQRGAIFSTVNGQAEVKFKLPKELRFTAKLKSNAKDEKVLAGYIMHRVVGDMAVFTVTAPESDEYGLEIYANDPEADGNSLYHAFQYLLICNDVKGPIEPLPTLPPGYLGPQPNFKKLGLTANTHTDSYLQTDNGDLQIAFGLTQQLRMTSQLIFVSSGANEDTSEYILQQGKGNDVTFKLKLPKTGMYKFQIYALPFSDTSESLPGVYNYLIHCRMTHATLTPFPKQYGQWKEGCYLHEPLEGVLEANRPNKGAASSFNHYLFKVDVAKSSSVAVVIGDDWTQLQDNNGCWEGEVDMSKHWGKENKAALCANYGQAKASYSTLLEYQM